MVKYLVGLCSDAKKEETGRPTDVYSDSSGESEDDITVTRAEALRFVRE